MTGDEPAGERDAALPPATFAAIRMAAAPHARSWRAHPLRRALLIGGSVAAHLLALQLILWAQPTAPPFAEPPAVNVAMVKLPPTPVPPPPPPPPSKPREPGGKPKVATPTPAPPTPPHASFARRTPAPPRPDAPPASAKPSPEPFLEIGEDQARLAAGDSDGNGQGVGTGSGNGPGGECNMAKRLQSALSRDARVKAAISGATGARGSTGRGMVVWNGDWVTSGGEEGKGLAAVRQAIIWEVGFAPKACREQAVRGYVLVSLSGGMRIALGTGHWRWSDLLKL